MKKLFLTFVLVFLSLFCLVGCNENKVTEDELNRAGEFVKSMYKNKKTASDDFEVVQSVIIDGVTFKVEWSVEVVSGPAADVNVLKGSENTVIEINEKSEEDCKFNLIAKISYEDLVIQVKLENILHEGYKVMSWEDVNAAEEGAVINATGVITGIVGTDKLNVYFENEQGGYYIYNYAPTAENKSKIVVGATIEVSGEKDVYNGLVEFINSTVVVLDEAVKTVEPKDVTELVVAAKDNKAETLTRLVSQYVTVKGVEMVDITNDGKYLNFKLGNVSTYVYISSSSNMVTADEINELNAKVVKGRTATISGMVALYNGAFYIIPNTVDSITLDALPELSDAEKVADAEAKVKSLAENKVVGNLKLFTTTDFEGVSVVWESSNEELITAEGKLVKYPVEDTKVELTATIKSGNETKEVKVEVTVAGLVKMTIAEANKLFGDERAVWVEGKIVATYNKGKGSFIADETGVMYVYTTLPEGYVVGDFVKIIGNLKVYENSGKEYTRQLTTISIEKLETAVEVLEPVKVDLAAVANKFGADQESYKMSEAEKAMAISSKYYGGLYEFTGYVVPHTFGTYTNYGLAVEEAGTTFVLYQYQNDMQDEFKALVGKKVTIVAPMYGYSAQYGWRIGTYLSVTEEAAPALPTTTDTCAAAKSAEANTVVTLIGQVIAVYQNNGFVLKDNSGSIYVYVKGDTSAYAPGNIVKVTGKTGNYKGPQIGNSDLVVEVLELAELDINPTSLTVEEYLALDANELANYGKEVKVVGTVVKNGDYVNFKLDDSKTANLYLSAEQKAVLGTLEGKKVELVGVIYNKSGDYPFTMLMVSFTEVAE